MGLESLGFGISWNFLLFFKRWWHWCVWEKQWSRSFWQMPTPFTGVWGLTQVFEVYDTCGYIITLCVCRILHLYQHIILCLHAHSISSAFSIWWWEWSSSHQCSLVLTLSECPICHGFWGSGHNSFYVHRDQIQDHPVFHICGCKFNGLSWGTPKCPTVNPITKNCQPQLDQPKFASSSYSACGTEHSQLHH